MSVPGAPDPPGPAPTAPRHRRRSSLSEALHAERLDSPASTPGSKAGSQGVSPSHFVSQQQQQQPRSGASTPASPQPAPSEPGHSPGSSRASSKAVPIAVQPTHGASEAEGLSGHHHPPEASPFVSPDTPSYTLEPLKEPASPGLAVVPEDAASPQSEQLQPQLAQLPPKARSLPRVRTPRASEDGGGGGAAHTPDAAGLRSAGGQAPELGAALAEQLSFRNPAAGTLTTFNPFDAGQPGFSASPQGVASPPADDSFFAMDLPEGSAQQQQQQQQQQGQPQQLALDFGARSGSGVIGPRIEEAGGALGRRQSDKFRVREGEDAEVAQLLWVAENLREELRGAEAALQAALATAAEHDALAERYQERLKQAEADAAEAGEELLTMHSRLEAHLLTKLEQEEEIRVTGDRLRAVRAEVASLDEALRAAEESRRSLERQAAERRASQRRQLPEGGEAGGAGDAREEGAAEAGGSPKSLYSSAWGTSDSEEGEAPDLGAAGLAAPRPSVSLDDDNQAKLKEKGGLGGFWLRSVLSGRSRSQPPPPPVLPASPEPPQKAVGAGQSHFEQPAAAAELEAAQEEQLESAASR